MCKMSISHITWNSTRCICHLLRPPPLPTYHLAVSPQPLKRCSTYGFTDARGRRQLSTRAAAEKEQACSLTDNKSGADACRGKLGLSRSLALIRLHKPSWSPRPKLRRAAAEAASHWISVQKYTLLFARRSSHLFFFSFQKLHQKGTRGEMKINESCVYLHFTHGWDTWLRGQTWGPSLFMFVCFCASFFPSLSSSSSFFLLLLFLCLLVLLLLGLYFPTSTLSCFPSSPDSSVSLGPWEEKKGAELLSKREKESK